MIKKALFTTPIYYVNGRCHIGHLHTQFLAEAMSLWWSIDRKLENGKLEKKKFYLSTGTDEHGLKIQKEAEQRNTTPQILSDEISKSFKETFDFYKIKYTNFIRTTQPDHIETVKKFWKNIEKDIYKGEYSGYYSVSDECFVTDYIEKDGKIYTKDSNKICEWMNEKNYKFALIKYKEQLKKILEESKMIYPKDRLIQTLQMLDEISDLSISRSSNRVNWGIQVPEDPEQTIYVWLDALANYYTIGSRNDVNIWPPEVQVIGKDILKFHAIYWNAFLLSHGLELPKRILVHGHWKVEGIKMSKSLGNVVDGLEIGKKYGPENIRYYLLKNANLADDSDFFENEIPNTVNELADNQGNLLMRCFSSKIYDSSPIQCIGLTGNDKIMIKEINELCVKIRGFYSNGDFMHGLIKTHEILRKANQLVDYEKVWTLKGQDRLKTIQYIVVECLRISSISFYPVIPEKMEKIMKYLKLDFDKDVSSIYLEFDEKKIYQIDNNPPRIHEKIKYKQ